jgi:C1A family cysteine protease
MMHRTYGWRRDLPDKRDVPFAPREHVTDLTLPPAIDLRPLCPVVYDQGSLGSCTANALAGALEFDLKSKGQDFAPSRLFIYYAERSMEGTVASDAGAYIRDGAKVVSHLGVPDERLWTYYEPRFDKRPPKSVYKAALAHRAVSYAKVRQTHDDLRRTLAAGFPVVFGFSVYESFESSAVAKTGIVPMPSMSEDMLGGHAVMLVGYDDSEQRYIVRNSWSSGWGMLGYCTMPYAYVEDPDLASDFWTFRAVT